MNQFIIYCTSAHGADNNQLSILSKYVLEIIYLYQIQHYVFHFPSRTCCTCIFARYNIVKLLNALAPQCSTRLRMSAVYLLNTPPRTHVLAYAHALTRTRTLAYAHVHARTHAHVNARKRLPAPPPARTYMRTAKRTYTRMHAYTHTCIHIRVCLHVYLPLICIQNRHSPSTSIPLFTLGLNAILTFNHSCRSQLCLA